MAKKYDIKQIVADWLEERYIAYVDMGVDDWADDPDDYAVECMEEYSNDPAAIVNDYIEEVEEAFDDDAKFVADNRAAIDQAVIDWYKENNY